MIQNIFTSDCFIVIYIILGVGVCVCVSVADFVAWRLLCSRCDATENGEMNETEWKRKLIEPGEKIISHIHNCILCLLHVNMQRFTFIPLSESWSLPSHAFDALPLSRRSATALSAGEQGSAVPRLSSVRSAPNAMDTAVAAQCERVHATAEAEPKRS